MTTANPPVEHLSVRVPCLDNSAAVHDLIRRHLL